MKIDIECYEIFIIDKVDKKMFIEREKFLINYVMCIKKIKFMGLIGLICFKVYFFGIIIMFYSFFLR